MDKLSKDVGQLAEAPSQRSRTDELLGSIGGMIVNLESKLSKVLRIDSPDQAKAEVEVVEKTGLNKALLIFRDKLEDLIGRIEL